MNLNAVDNTLEIFEIDVPETVTSSKPLASLVPSPAPDFYRDCCKV